MYLWIPEPEHARDELQECYRWKWTNWGVIDQNLLLPTAPCSQLRMALTVGKVWKKPQTSCIWCKPCHLHLQVPQHLKILSSTHKYQSRDCKHVFLPPFISSNETEFAAQPQPAVCRPGASPLPASPAMCSSCPCKWRSDTFLQFKLSLLSAQVIAWSCNCQHYLPLPPACVRKSHHLLW